MLELMRHLPIRFVSNSASASAFCDLGVWAGGGWNVSGVSCLTGRMSHGGRGGAGGGRGGACQSEGSRCCSIPAESGAGGRPGRSARF